MDLEQTIRDVPDFPKPGIIFKDITPLLADPEALADAVTQLVAPYALVGVDVVTGVESRGFIFGSLAAQRLGVGFEEFPVGDRSDSLGARWHGPYTNK